MNGFFSSKVGYEEYLWAPSWRLRPRNIGAEILNEVSNTTCWVQPSSVGILGIHNNDEKFSSHPRPRVTPVSWDKLVLIPVPPAKQAVSLKLHFLWILPAVLLSDLKRALSPTDPA